MRALSGVPYDRRMCRRMLAGGLLIGVMLAIGACGVPVPHVGPPLPSTPATGNRPSSVYIRGGALNATDGTTRWTGDLGAQPPILAGGILYVVAPQLPTQGQETTGVKAVRASDGKVLWTAPVPNAEGSLVLAGDRLIVPAAQAALNQPGTLTLTALRTSDGGVLWQSAPINVQRQPTVDTRTPIISNLVVSNGLVVGMAASTSSDSYIIAWHLSDGTVAWRQSLNDASSFAGPAGTVTLTGTTLTIAYSSASGERIVGLDPATGKSVWPAPVTAASLDLVTTSMAVFSDSATNTVTGVRLSDGAALWQRALGPSAVRRLEELDASDSTVFYRHFEPCQSQQCPAIYAISLANGSVVWHRTLSPANPDYAISSAYGDGTLYYVFFQQNASGTQFMLTALRAADGSIAWTHQIAPTPLTHLTIGDGMMYMYGRGSDSNCPLTIEALRTTDASLAWQHAYTPCPNIIFSPPWLLVA